MNITKKYLGIVWFLLGLVAGWFSVTNIGLPKFTNGLAGNQSDLVFGIITLFILTPLIVGALLVFGWYAWQGEYENKDNT
jgi:hypothetical protein